MSFNIYRFASPQAFYPLAGKMIPWFWALAALFGIAGLYVGFLVAPTDAVGPCLRVRVRQGFLRVAADRPAFTATDRRGEGLGDGVAALHLAHPTGSLRAFGRHQTTLDLAEVPDADAAAARIEALF